MKKKSFIFAPLIFMIFSFCSLTCNGQIAWKWAKSFGGINDQTASDIAMDTIGNIYLTGSFWFSATFGNETFKANPNYGYGGFVCKYDKVGNLIWARQINEDNEDKFGNAICLDKNYNIYVTGSKINNTDATGKSFLVKYSNDGTLQWSKLFENEVWDEDRHKSIGYLKDVVCISTKNNLYSFDSEGNLLSSLGIGVNCITDDGENYFYAANKNQVFVLDSSLSIIKNITVDYENYWINAICVKNDSIYLAGFFTETEGGKRNMLIVKLDNLGNVIWSKAAESEEYSGTQANGIILDNSNKIYITGSYWGIVHFDSLTIDGWGFGSEVFVAKCDDITGNIEALIHGGGMDSDLGNCLALLSDNSLIIAGMVRQPMASTLNFGDILVPFPRENGNDLFIANVVESNFKSTLSGQVTINDAEPVFSYISLYREKEDSTFELINRTMTDYNGIYSFTVYQSGTYLIKSEKHQHINTYYYQTYLWNNADKIEIKTDTTINNININILQCEQLTGEDSISGRIFSNDSVLISFVKILLVSTDDSLVSFTQTDSLGYYYFPNVPKGQFKILVDSAGEVMDSYYTIINSKKSGSTYSDRKSYNNCDYIFGKDHKIYKKSPTVIGIRHFMTNSLIIYPNPSNSYLNVKGAFENNDVTLKIFDQLGRCLFLSKENFQNINIDVSFLNDGMYYLYLDNNNGKCGVAAFSIIK